MGAEVFSRDRAYNPGPIKGPIYIGEAKINGSKLYGSMDIYDRPKLP
jgi:hypothetical protein